MKVLIKKRNKKKLHFFESAMETVKFLPDGIKARVFAFALSNMGCPEPILEVIKENEHLSSFPFLALQTGICLEKYNMEAISMYGKAFGLEFSHSFNTNAPLQDVLDAHLLIIPHLLDNLNPFAIKNVRLHDFAANKQIFSSEATKLHAKISDIRKHEGFPRLVLIHTWWQIFSNVSKEKLNKLHRIAAKNALHIASILPYDASATKVLYKAAKEHLEKVDNKAAVSCELGELFITFGEFSKAVELASDETRFEIHTKNQCICRDSILGQAYFALGDRESSLKHYENCWLSLQQKIKNGLVDEGDKKEETCDNSSISKVEDQYHSDACNLKSVDGLVQYAQLEQEDGNLKKAAEILKIVINNFSHLTKNQNHLGLLYYSFGTLLFHLGSHHELTVQILKEAVTILPEHINARNNLGAAMFTVGNFRGAADNLISGLRLCDLKLTNNDNVEIEKCKVSSRLNLALVFENMGEYDSATAHIRAVLQLQQSIKEINQDDVLSVDRTTLQRQLARLLKAKGKLRPALDILQGTAKVLQMELKRIDTSKRIAQIENKKKKPFVPKAVRKVYNDLSDTLRDLGLALTESGKHDEAIKTFRRILLMHSVDESVATIALTGNSHQVSSDSTLWDVLDALPFRAIGDRLKHPQPLVDLGNAYFYAKNSDQAKRLYSWCIKLFPKESNAMNNLGVIAFQEENWKLATSYFNKALSINPKNHMAKSALAHVNENGPAPYMNTVLSSSPPVPHKGGGTIVAPHISDL